MEENVEGDDENAVKVYRLATEKTIDSLMAQYKKLKSQHSPIPPGLNDNMDRRKSFDKRNSMSVDRNQTEAEKNNEKSVIKVFI